MTKAIHERVVDLLVKHIVLEDNMTETDFLIDQEIHNYCSHKLRQIKDEIKGIVKNELSKQKPT